MQNNTRIFFDKIVSRTKIYLVIILILLITICIQDTKWIIPSIILYVLVVIYATFADNKRKNELSESLQDLTITVDSAAKTSLINSPFPLVILETTGKVIWRSSKFVSEFANIDIQNYLTELLYDIKQEIENKKDSKDNNDKSVIINQVEIGNRIYKIFGRFVNSKKSNNSKYTIILYFIDETESIKLQKEYTDSKSCVEIIMIDNYEENMQLIDSEEKPQLTAEIDKCIFDWTNETNGVLIKSDRDTFFCVMEKKYLKEAEADKFIILDEVKKIDIPDITQPTLSIGFSDDGSTNSEKGSSARTVIDIALGRGGDQAIVKMDGRYQFFGGRTQEVEKRTKVKARMISHALTELISEADNVLLMGHSNGDMDSIGSSMGLYRLSKKLGKEAKIINETTGIGIDNFIIEAKKTGEYL